MVFGLGAHLKGGIKNDIVFFRRALYLVPRNKEMRFYKITFEDGNVVRTGFNGNLAQAKSYYLGQAFELTEGKSVKAIEVEEID